MAPPPERLGSKPCSGVLPLLGPGWSHPSPDRPWYGVTLLPSKPSSLSGTPQGKSHSAGDSTLAGLSPTQAPSPVSLEDRAPSGRKPPRLLPSYPLSLLPPTTSPAHSDPSLALPRSQAFLGEPHHLTPPFPLSHPSHPNPDSPWTVLSPSL